MISQIINCLPLIYYLYCTDTGSQGTKSSADGVKAATSEYVGVVIHCFLFLISALYARVCIIFILYQCIYHALLLWYKNKVLYYEISLSQRLTKSLSILKHSRWFSREISSFLRRSATWCGINLDHIIYQTISFRKGGVKSMIYHRI